MSQKIAQGKAGIVATKKSDPLTVSNALLTDSQNKSVSNESLASEMETVIIQGTDFAKEFEKPNDRASHIKIGRAKQKVISGGQGSILHCTSVSGVTSANAGKPTATPPKTAAKPPDGPSRTSDLEGSAGNAVKSALKKATPTGTASITAPAPAKTGNVAVSKANVNVSPKAGNIINASKPNNMLPRPTPPMAVIGRTVEVAANISHRPNFPNMRSTIQAPGAVFPGVVQPRGRGPGANFSPQRPPASRMPANLFNAGRPGVPVMNVRNPLPMTAPPGGFNAVRPTIGIAARPTGPMSIRLASVCPVNKQDVRRTNAANSAVRQRSPLVPDKPGVKPCLNPPPKPVVLEANKVNSINDVVNESGRKGTDKPSPAIKTNPKTTTSVTAAPTKPTEGAASKTCNHETAKPVDNVPLGGNKTCTPQGVVSSSSSNNNTVKTAGKPIGTKAPQSGGSQDFKVSSNNTTGNKTMKPTTPDGSLTKLQISNTCDNVGAVKLNQPSATTEKEQTTADSAAGVCDNSDVLDDGSKGGISFSFNRKLGQKLASSVPFGKEDDKARNSVNADKDSKTDASKEDSCADKSQDSNKEMPSAGMSFLKVLNKERTLELDWPVEMIQYTKTLPSISYSCNPLFFDFKGLLTKDKSQKEAQLKTKSDGDASISKTQTNNAGEKDEKESKNQSNADDSKSEKPSVRKSRKKKRKLSSQRQPDDDEAKSKKKKKKKRSKKREGKSEGGTSEKDDDKKTVDASKNKRHKKKKKRSHHSAPKSDLEQGHGEGGDGDVVNKSKTSHKSKHKKHKSRKSKKKRHKHDEFEKDSNTGHESEEDVAASAVAEQKNKNKNNRKPSQPGKEASNFSSDEELSKVQKAKPKPLPLSGAAGEKVVATTTAGEADVKLVTATVGDEDKDVCKKRNVSITNPPQTLESVDESKKKKDEASASKPGSCTERKRSAGEVDSPVGGKKRKLSSKNPCLKSEDTWSKMETIFEARSDPDGNKASWDTSSDSDVASHENKPNPKSKSADAGKRKKVANPSQPSEKPENNHNPMSKMSGASSGVKVEPKAETLHNSSGSDSDRPASAKQAYKRKKSYSGESHHSDGHCRSRDRSYSSSYSDRDSHYSDKSKHRHSRSHSSSRSRSRSRSASYERHSSRRGRRYSYSSYSDEDYRYRRGHSRSRSCSRRRSRTRSRSYSRSRRYRSYSSEHHRSYSSSSSRSRSRSESRGRSRSYSYSRSHSKSTSYSRSRSRSRSYHKSHSRSRSPHKSSSKQDYRHKNSPERSRYYSSSKKNSKHVSGGKGENEKGGSKLDPAKIPLPIMPGDVKEEPGEQGLEKSKDNKKSDTSKATTPTAAAAAATVGGPEVVSNLNSVRADLTAAGGTTGEPEAKSGLINIPLPPFQVAENAAQLGKVDNVDGQLQPPPPPPHMLSLPHYSNTGEVLMHHPIPDLSQPPPSTSLMPNCPPPPPPPPPPMLNNNGMMGAPSLYGHLSIPQPDVPRMNAPPPPPPPSGVVDPSMRMPLPFTPRSVSRHEQTGGKEMPGVSKSPIEATLQQAPPAAAAAAIVEVEKEMTPPLPPPKSPPPQPPPPPKKEEEKKSCEEISPMQPIIPPEQVEQYKHLQEMAQKHAMKQQRRQRMKDTGQPEESDDDESMEMEGQVSTIMSDEECDEQPGILALPDPEPQHLQRQILLPHAQHAGSPVIAQHMVPFSQQQIIIPPSSLLQSQGAFPIQTGGPMYAIPHSAAAAAAHHHHHHHHHPLAGHHHHAAALHHAFHPAAAAAAAAGMPLAAASHPFHHQLIAAAPGQLLPYSSPQPILTQYHPPGPIIIGHQVLIPRFPRTPM